MSRQQRVVRAPSSFGEKQLVKMPQLAKERVMLLQIKNGNASFSNKSVERPRAIVVVSDVDWHLHVSARRQLTPALLWRSHARGLARANIVPWMQPPCTPSAIRGMHMHSSFD